ncbi:hypothetical protein DFR70_1011012 [Nocardia tenerifensis]|uniref:Uncharacterized protein n=1 Tax=Nocardia tenerifensis TaxID=228006 RepID=A0A318KB68_9NOCA|nr:hypothetical protein [Nocardia tenerifensis]PXX71578.1 hypothetical protein DFR70_1011012 [Nocardia tenerifensis]
MSTRRSHRRRHIRIEYGVLSLDFQGTDEQIRSVANSLTAHAGLTVTVDDSVDPHLPPLPCGRLWEPG